MSPEKITLIGSIHQSRQSALAALQGIDPETVIHPESGWTVKDLIAHLTMWEIHYTKAIEAFNAGSEPYLIPNYVEEDIDDFNQRDYELHKNDTVETVLAGWALARENFIAAVNAVPEERMEERLPAPANPTQTPRVSTLIKFTLGHEKWHMGEIAAVVGA